MAAQHTVAPGAGVTEAQFREELSALPHKQAVECLKLVPFRQRQKCRVFLGLADEPSDRDRFADSKLCAAAIKACCSALSGLCPNISQSFPHLSRLNVSRASFRGTIDSLVTPARPLQELLLSGLLLEEEDQDEGLVEAGDCARQEAGDSDVSGDSDASEPRSRGESVLLALLRKCLPGHLQVLECINAYVALSNRLADALRTQSDLRSVSLSANPEGEDRGTFSLDDTGVITLARSCAKLQQLRVLHAAMSGSCLDDLLSLSDLRLLHLSAFTDYHHSSAVDESETPRLQHKQACTSLTELSLRLPSLGQEAGPLQDLVGRLPSVRHLLLECCHPKPLPMLVTSMPDLLELVLPPAALTDAAVRAIAVSCKRLRRIAAAEESREIVPSFPSAAALGSLAQLSELAYVHLSAGSFHLPHLQALAALPHLRVLGLHFMQYSAAHFDDITSMQLATAALPLPFPCLERFWLTFDPGQTANFRRAMQLKRLVSRSAGKLHHVLHALQALPKLAVLVPDAEESATCTEALLKNSYSSKETLRWRALVTALGTAGTPDRSAQLLGDPATLDDEEQTQPPLPVAERVRRRLGRLLQLQGIHDVGFYEVGDSDMEQLARALRSLGPEQLALAGQSGCSIALQPITDDALPAFQRSFDLLAPYLHKLSLMSLALSNAAVAALLRDSLSRCSELRRLSLGIAESSDEVLLAAGEVYRRASTLRDLRVTLHANEQADNGAAAALSTDAFLRFAEALAAPRSPAPSQSTDLHEVTVGLPFALQPSLLHNTASKLLPDRPMRLSLPRMTITPSPTGREMQALATLLRNSAGALSFPYPQPSRAGDASPASQIDALLQAGSYQLFGGGGGGSGRGGYGEEIELSKRSTLAARNTSLGDELPTLADISKPPTLQLPPRAARRSGGADAPSAAGEGTRGPKARAIPPARPQGGFGLPSFIPGAGFAPPGLPLQHGWSVPGGQLAPEAGEPAPPALRPGFMNNLLQAARTGDLQSVQTLLNELSDPATRLYAANQALCAPSLSLPVAQYLLRQERADPTGSRGAQALSNAIRMTGGFDLIELFLDAGASASGLLQPLLSSIELRMSPEYSTRISPLIRKMLTKGASLDEPGLLLSASLVDGALAVLLQAGADWRRGPADLLSRSVRYPEALQLLLERGADPNDGFVPLPGAMALLPGGINSLMSAFCNNTIQSAQLLLRAGASPLFMADVGSQRYVTVLNYATDVPRLRVLLENMPDARDRQVLLNFVVPAPDHPTTVLHSVLCNELFDAKNTTFPLIRMMLEAGARPARQPDGTNSTLVEYAVTRGATPAQLEALRDLLSPYQS